MGKIEKFGIFPMLSEDPFDEAQFNAKFDFTWLLAYFNQNDTVLDVIVPDIYLESFATGRISWFISISDSPRRLDRSGLCFTVTNKLYKVAVLAMYARSKPTEILRPMAEEMVGAIITAFKDVVQENKWMDRTFKKIPKFNVSLDGTSTLAENIADNEGIKIAYRAYKKYTARLKDSAKSENVDGFTQNQLFFLGFSQHGTKAAVTIRTRDEWMNIHRQETNLMNGQLNGVANAEDVDKKLILCCLYLS